MPPSKSSRSDCASILQGRVDQLGRALFVLLDELVEHVEHGLGLGQLEQRGDRVQKVAHRPVLDVGTGVRDRLGRRTSRCARCLCPSSGRAMRSSFSTVLRVFGAAANQRDRVAHQRRQRGLVGVEGLVRGLAADQRERGPLLAIAMAESSRPATKNGVGARVAQRDRVALVVAASTGSGVSVLPLRP